jgi:hypothetical protein
MIIEVEGLISKASERKVQLSHKIAQETAAAALQSSQQSSRSASNASENSSTVQKHSSFRFGSKKH